MSYQVLSRKWRPQIFNDVVGQEAVTRTLQNAIKSDRVGHGFLFSGLRGIGKTTTARILAKTLNCQKRAEENPCNACNNCNDITQGRSLDVQEIDGASNRGIDEIRELREAVKYPASSGMYRIYIIDEVHMLTTQAFNALLKTLEEPPEHVKFIMATTDPQKVPQTIHSRTLRFDFKRVRQNELIAHLEKIINAENMKYDDLSLQLISKKADGSVRDALSLLDQSIAYTGGNLDGKSVGEVLGIIPESLYLQVLKGILKKDGQVIATVHDALNGGISLGDFILGFNQFMNQCMLALSGINTGLDISSETKKQLESNEHSIQVLDILRIHDQTQRFESKLRYLTFPLVSFDSLLIKLLSMESTISISELLGKSNQTNVKSPPQKIQVRQKKTKKIIEPTQPAQQVSEPKIDLEISEKTEPLQSSANGSPAKPSIDIQFFTRNWDDFLTLVQAEHPKYITYLDNAVPCQVKGDTLELDLTNGDPFQCSGLKKNIEKLEAMLSEYSGHSIRLKLKQIPVEKDMNGSVQKEIKKPTIKEHPLFEQVMEKFDGEILRS